MEIINHKQLLSRPRHEHKWLVKGLIRSASIGFIAGEAKTYKSWLSLHIAQAIATGTKVLGAFEVPRPARVLLVQEEDDANTVSERYALLKKGHALPEPVVGHILFSIHNGLKIDNPTTVNAFRSHLTDLGAKGMLPDLIIFDVLNKLHDGNDANQKQATAVMRAFEKLRRDFGCAIIIIHHFGKKSGKRGNQRMRGSSVFAGWSENSLYVSRSGNKIDVEVENKFAQTENFSYKIESGVDSVKLVIAEDKGFVLPPIEERIGLSKRDRADLMRRWELSHQK